MNPDTLIDSAIILLTILVIAYIARVEIKRYSK
jgi:hypothetical protein